MKIPEKQAVLDGVLGIKMWFRVDFVGFNDDQRLNAAELRRGSYVQRQSGAARADGKIGCGGRGSASLRLEAFGGSIVGRMAEEQPAMSKEVDRCRMRSAGATSRLEGECLAVGRREEEMDG